MNASQQISRRFGRTTGARTRSAADYSITATISVVPDPFKPGKTLPRFVLRTVTVLRDDYLSYIGSEVDGRGNRESPVVLNTLGAIGLPKILMVVELSLPQLFPANKRKVGEFIFDATKSSCFDLRRTIKNTFLYGRMPGEYLQPVNKSIGGLSFRRRKSMIVDHTKLLYT